MDPRSEPEVLGFFLFSALLPVGHAINNCSDMSETKLKLLVQIKSPMYARSTTHYTE